MNRLLICGAILGLFSVIMGALGDHSFELTPEKADSLDTAIRYNMIYAVLISALALFSDDKKLRLSGYIFTLGTVFFSFGIYTALATGIKQFTYFTPVGGIMIMFGWGILTYCAVKFKR